MDAEPELAWSISGENKTSRYGGPEKSFKVILLNQNQLLFSSDNTISLYDFGRKKIVYTIGGAQGHFVMHPSKRFFAVVRKAPKRASYGNKGVVSLHDISSGKEIASQATSGVTSVGFSQDRRKVVVVDSKVRVWDLQLASEPVVRRRRNLLKYRIGNGDRTGTIDLIDDNWIKGGQQLYSLEKEIVVWSYSTYSDSSSGFGVSIRKSQMLGNWNLLAGIKRRKSYLGEMPLALIGLAKVPHAPARHAFDKLNAVDMLMLKPGSSVRVDEGIQDDRIRSSIMRAIKANDWRVDPNAEVLIRASAKRGKSVTQEFGNARTVWGFESHRLPIPGQTTTVTAAPWIQRVEIVYLKDEQIAWSRQSGNVPSSFLVLEGGSVQAAMNKATKPTYEMFENLELPKELIYPKFKNGLGRTAITVNGFVDKLYAEVPEELDDDPLEKGEEKEGEGK